MANLAAHPRSRQLTAIFLTALQAEGFAMGVGHHQAVQELLERLPEETPEETLGDSLVALLATGKAEQARCRMLFAQAREQVAAMHGPLPKKSDPIAQEAKAEKHKLIRRLVGLAAILLVPLLTWFFWPEQEVKLGHSEREISVFAGKQNFITGVDSLPELGTISSYELPEYGKRGYPLIGRVDTAGTRLFYQANPYDSTTTRDAFTVTLHGTDKRFAQLSFEVFVEQDTARPQVQREDIGAVEEEVKTDVEPDYSPFKPLPFPRTLADLAVAEPKGFGYKDFLHYAWWPLLLLGFGALLLGWYLWLRYRRKQDVRLIAQREQFDGAPHFWRIELPELRTAIDWGVNYPSLLRQLRRRREDDHLELDLGRSIQRTIDQGGMPSFSYRSVTRPSEYLLLLDRGVHANHYTRLFDQLFDQLRAEEVLIDRYFYDGDPRLLYQGDRAKAVSLTSLQRRYPESHLLVVGPGDRLLSPATGKLTKWATEQFGGWEQRSLLTTLPPGDWGVEERRLAQFFALLPATMQGLRLLVERTNDGQPDEAGVDYRNLIEDADQKPIELSGSLIGSLLDHYTLPQTQWIAACALYPTLHWDLTLFMGQTVGEATNENLLSSRNLLSLSRLAWFTNGTIPPAARTELTRWLRETAPELHQTCRLALQAALEKHAPAPEGSVARRELDFFRLQNEWLLAADDPSRRAALSEELAREIAAGNDPDVTVARVLEDETPPQGALPLPQSWNQRLYPEGLPGLGYKPELGRLLPALFLLIPLLLAGWWLRPDPANNGHCTNPDAVIFQVKDTVTFARDSFVNIQVCGKADSLILAEYVWNARIHAANSLADLDTALARWQILGAFLNGRPVGLPTPSTTLTNWLQRPARDSLDQTHRANVGAMLWNKGIADWGYVEWLYNETCNYLAVADSLLTLSDGRRLAYENMCPPEQIIQEPVVPEQDPIQQAPPPTPQQRQEAAEAAENAALRYRVNNTIGSLQKLDRELNQLPIIKKVVVAPMRQRINFWIRQAQAKLANNTISSRDLNDGMDIGRSARNLLSKETSRRQNDNAQAPAQNTGGIPEQTTVAARTVFLSCPSNYCGDFQVGANWTTESNPKQFIVTMENRSNAGLDYFVVDWGDGGADTVRNYRSVSHRYSPEIVAAGGEIPVYLRGVKTCDGGFSCEDVISEVAFFKKEERFAVPKPAMIRIPGGTFKMGDTFGDGDENELPVHSVTLSSFYMGQNEVTFDEYVLYCEQTGRRRPRDLGWGQGRRPVMDVSWWDAVEYCNWLSKAHELTPVYSIDAKADKISADWKANGYRLPTEAEWEYAAAVRLDGTKARFGNGRDTLRAEEANFDAREDYVELFSKVGEYRDKTVPVGTFSGNERKLNDMSGNVREWCWDWLGFDYYSKLPIKNPIGPDVGSYRVIRGGGWSDKASLSRAATRGNRGPMSYGAVGFRLARSY